MGETTAANGQKPSQTSRMGNTPDLSWGVGYTGFATSVKQPLIKFGWYRLLVKNVLLYCEKASHSGNTTPLPDLFGASLKVYPCSGQLSTGFDGVTKPPIR